MEYRYQISYMRCINVT